MSDQTIPVARQHSMWDPHPTLRDLIDAHEAADREREPDQPIRVVRGMAMAADGWAASAAHSHESRHARRGYCDLATLGRRLGVPVGKVLGGAVR